MIVYINVMLVFPRGNTLAKCRIIIASSPLLFTVSYALTLKLPVPPFCLQSRKDNCIKNQGRLPEFTATNFRFIQSAVNYIAVPEDEWNYTAVLEGEWNYTAVLEGEWN